MGQNLPAASYSMNVKSRVQLAIVKMKRRGGPWVCLSHGMEVTELWLKAEDTSTSFCDAGVLKDGFKFLGKCNNN